jgi:hypothetical protein
MVKEQQILQIHKGMHMPTTITIINHHSLFVQILIDWLNWLADAGVSIGSHEDVKTLVSWC